MRLEVWMEPDTVGWMGHDCLPFGECYATMTSGEGNVLIGRAIGRFVELTHLGLRYRTYSKGS